MRIGVTGATGFIGSRIIDLVAQQGHSVTCFTRNPRCLIQHCADTRSFSLDTKVNIDGCDALIHLAGEPVVGLWTKEKRRRILESRVLGTRHLVDAIMACANPPGVLVSSSAIGFYGETGETAVDEDTAAGTGFLAEVSKAWESEAMRACEKNVRVVLLRTSIVVGRNGGALRPMLPVFRAGLGGRLGSGRQWMSWIHIDDEAALALFAVEHDSIAGPLNAVAPEPCRNAAFTDTLARVLHRPAFFHVPAFVLRTTLGDFSHELLASKRVLPKRALAAGFQHRFSTVDTALASLLTT
jgi:hypothetical protein